MCVYVPLSFLPYKDSSYPSLLLRLNIVLPPVVGCIGNYTPISMCHILVTE